jgi:hypothetical protein
MNRRNTTATQSSTRMVQNSMPQKRAPQVPLVSNDFFKRASRQTSAKAF